MIKIGENTIRKRLMIAFVLIGVIPVVLGAAGSVTAEIYNGQQQARVRLQSVSATKDTAIIGWANEVFQELAVISFTDTTYERISVVLSLAQDNVYLDFYNKAVRTKLNGFVNQSQYLRELFLVDLEGKVVISTQSDHQGAVISYREYFMQGLVQKSLSLPFKDSPDDHSYQNQPVAIFAVPMTGLDGQIAGILAAKVDITELQSILKDQTGLGSTGKSYILSTNKIPLITANILDFVPGNQIAFEGESNSIDVYKNNQDTNVIGVYRWLPDNWGVLFVEQDQSEAIGIVITTLGINLAIALSALIIAIILSIIISRGIARPVENLAQTATFIAAGDLERVADIEQEDEIGLLAKAFNSMTEQLRLLINTLEQRVESRTQDLQHLALQLETSAQVSREITSILDVDQLLGNLTELIKGAFGYYGVHIYLIDNDTNQLVYWGDKKNQMPHLITLPIGNGSLNGDVASQNQALVINDVKLDERFLLDENFPDTKAELVVPLRIGDRIIGTLDLLNVEANTFTNEDLIVAQSLGDQIAIAIENARLYERSQSLAVLEERNRMARQLHDSMNQSLYSVILLSGAGQNEINKPNFQKARKYFERIELMAQQALKEMRLMVFELRPKVLDQKGLMGALKQRLDTVEQGAGLDVKYVSEGDFKLAPEIEEGLYRIAQEALNNALKHSRTKKLHVEVFVKNGKLEMTIEDSGIGFDPLLIEQKGMGLTNMHERAEELGASFQIESAPGSGTRVHLVLKIKPIEVVP